MYREKIVSDGLASLPESVRFLSISRSKLYAVMERGELPYVRIGRCRRIPRRALIEFAAAHLVGGLRVGGE